MSLQRIILELGTGNDLYGGDYTKAALRAVQDALHHSSLLLFRSLDIDPQTMQVEVTIGVQDPDALDLRQIAEQIPYGQVQVIPRFGGLNVVDPDNAITSIIATAAIAVRLELPAGQFTL